MEEAWFMAPMEKELRPQWNVPSWFIVPMEKAWFYEILFFQAVIVMVKDKKRCTVKDTMSIKISFMHYRNYFTRAKVAYQEVTDSFRGICGLYFLTPFFFSLSLLIGKSLTLVKIWGGGGGVAASPPLALPVSTGLWLFAPYLIGLKF